MLELAEQATEQNIEVKNIFLALGSGCTTAGILLGAVLARHLKINMFPNLKVRSVIIHHVYAKVSTYSFYFSLFFISSLFIFSLFLLFSFFLVLCWPTFKDNMFQI